MRDARPADLLVAIWANQLEMQTTSFGADPMTLEGEERVQYIKDMVLAATDELHEALGEVGWKPWATSRHVNDEALKGELIDLLHFVINLMLVARMTPEEIHHRYFVKAARNRQRQLEGYDGRSGKCSGCGRALDDPATRCTAEACAEVPA